MACAVCNRGSSPLGWLDPLKPINERVLLRACSRACQDIIMRTHGMIDPSENEIAAIQASSEPAGEYLESLGKTDLAQLEESEWLSLLEVVVTAYTDRLRELEAEK